MRVLVQEIDRYGDSAPRAEMVFLDDGPNSFKGEDGKVDKELVVHCFNQAFDEDVTVKDLLENLTQPSLVMSKDGRRVLLSGEETDYTFVNIDPLLED